MVFMCFLLQRWPHFLLTIFISWRAKGTTSNGKIQILYIAKKHVEDFANTIPWDRFLNIMLLLFRISKNEGKVLGYPPTNLFPENGLKRLKSSWNVKKTFRLQCTDFDDFLQMDAMWGKHNFDLYMKCLQTPQKGGNSLREGLTYLALFCVGLTNCQRRSCASSMHRL